MGDEEGEAVTEGPAPDSDGGTGGEGTDKVGFLKVPILYLYLLINFTKTWMNVK